MLYSDPTYSPGELLTWLSDIDFRAWEGQEFKARDAVREIGDGFLNSEGFKYWEDQKVHHLQCYGTAGSGKVRNDMTFQITTLTTAQTYLAYLVSTHLCQCKTNTCVVSVYIERKNPTITVEQLLRAMLKQTLEARKPKRISTKLRQYHETESSNKQLPQKEELIDFLENEVLTYEYVYVVVDGLNDASADIQDDLPTAINQLRERTKKAGVLYFKREDEVAPTTLPFFNNCGKVALVHYRCEQCPSPFFDLCPS